MAWSRASGPQTRQRFCRPHAPRTLIKLLDFGIAKLRVSEGAQGPDAARSAHGDAGVHGSRAGFLGRYGRLAGRIYAIGVMLFEMIRGADPWWPMIRESWPPLSSRQTCRV